MNRYEAIAISVRRSPLLSGAGPLWRLVRPLYKWTLRSLGRTGLRRDINGTDTILLAPELYNMPEVYEPEVWRAIMREIRPGDMFVDVGANYGLYSVAVAKRVGLDGSVHAFEPDRETVAVLRRQIALNHVTARVAVGAYAVGDYVGFVPFTDGRGVESHVGSSDGIEPAQVPSTTLDAAFPHSKVDILKIDVEGFEEKVLLGSLGLLADPARAPRAIFIEVHPAGLARFGSTGAQILSLLRDRGYEVVDLQGRAVSELVEYGEVVARSLRTRNVAGI